ncbi:MAG: efflux RND transporter periplasmic adaptor subunit [Proteobacteria bacterium]|nr:efflux RND transporter periplasmic adaptor subunit [Pseudomonadota bacterium]
MPPTNPKDTPLQNKRRKMLMLIAIVAIVLGAAWLLWHLLVGRWSENTDDAYVQGDVVTITPQVGGTVTRIGVDDGMKVVAGQVLVGFDTNDSDLAYAQAEAALGSAVRQVRAQYRAAEAGGADIDAREATVKQAQAAVDVARQDVARRTGLVATGAVSSEELAHARAQLETAQANLAAAQAAVSGARENTARSRVLIDNSTIRDNPAVAAAASQLRQAYLARQRSSVLSPISGYVAKRSVQLGQRVAPGTPMMAIIPLDQVWVDANFKETQLTKLRLNQRVELTSELYGDKVVYHGTLASLGMGTGSAFSVLPAQNASGNWIKIVQRVPVRILLDKKELQEHPLRLGLSMDVKVNLHDKGDGLLPTTTPTQPHLMTDAYDSALSKADAAVEHVIDDNLGGNGSH